MLFKCLPEGRPIPGRFPGPVHARGKWFTIDIHCHLLTEKAEELVKNAGLSMDWQPRHQFANELTRETNREQARRTRVQFTSIEKRLADMDLMGIDIQAITPSPAQTFYSVPPICIETARVINDNTVVYLRQAPRPFRRGSARCRSGTRFMVAELDRLHKSLGLRGIEIATNVAGADLPEERLSGRSSAVPSGAGPVVYAPGIRLEASRFRDHYFTNIIGNPPSTPRSRCII